MGVDRLVDGQVPARRTVGVAGRERRLAHEQVGVAGEVGQPLAGPESPEYASVVPLAATRKP